jgi:hypothetical protein
MGNMGRWTIAAERAGNQEEQHSMQVDCTKWQGNRLQAQPTYQSL